MFRYIHSGYGNFLHIIRLKWPKISREILVHQNVSLIERSWLYCTNLNCLKSKNTLKVLNNYPFKNDKFPRCLLYKWYFSCCTPYNMCMKNHHVNCNTFRPYLRHSPLNKYITLQQKTTFDHFTSNQFSFELTLLHATLSSANLDVSSYLPSSPSLFCDVQSNTINTQ